MPHHRKKNEFFPDFAISLKTFILGARCRAVTTHETHVYMYTCYDWVKFCDKPQNFPARCRGAAAWSCMQYIGCKRHQAISS
jgi:hypothetical protein